MTTAPSPVVDDDDTKTSGRTILFLFIGLMITMLLAALNQTMLATALPTIVGDLNGVDQMSWVITGYILATTVVMPVYGRISDILGRKPVLLTAITLFIVGSIIGGLSGNIEMLIIARVVQGLGGGGLMILSQAAIADVVPARDRGKYMGAMGAVFAVASVAGPLLGGWLTEGPGWRWAFWLNLPLGALAIAATIAFMHLPKKVHETKPKLDYLGMALIAGATTTLTLACTWGGTTYGWGSPQIIGLFVATAVLAAAFCWAETKAELPTIPMSLFRERNFTLTVIAALAVGVAMFGTIGYMPTYIQMVSGVDATQAGLLMIPMMGGLLVTSIASGQAVSRTGKYKGYPLAGTLVMAIGMVLLSQMTIDTPKWEMCLYLGVFGAGIGLCMQILTLIVQNTFPGRIVGTATAASNYFRQVGATLGSAVVGAVFTSRLKTELGERLHGGEMSGDAARQHLTPGEVNKLPGEIRIPVIEAYNEALLPVFLFLVPLIIVAFLVLLFIERKDLATTVKNEIPAESLAEGQLLEMVDQDDLYGKPGDTAGSASTSRAPAKS
ncbi:MDR family MFS transporter [Gordonia sp. VNK21]|uniref:MDR family MFS transporter n=1 Tax=Gordonia sp. VNK21 TaxID=3382483 RepID=UPI0038D44029